LGEHSGGIAIERGLRPSVWRSRRIRARAGSP